MSISIIGNGGLAREVGSYLKSMGMVFDYFVSDQYYEKKEKVYKLSELPIENPTLIAIADVNVKKRIHENLSPDLSYYTFVHPSVQIFTESEIDEGSIICPNVVITTNVKIGKHGLINCNCTIGHDTIVGDYFTINPNCAISGNCIIGNNVFIGTSSSIREKTKISDDVTIGMGSVVVKNIDIVGTYVGIPARRIS